MQLIYLSPVPWASFSQRPHHFVDWFHGKTGGAVLWVDPYLTRFPVPTDLQYLRTAKGGEQLVQPGWIRVIRPFALPIEPLPGSSLANGLFWRKTLHIIDLFARERVTLLAIGKPSLLALALLKRLKGCRSLYDAMDDFPVFYSGLSRLAVRKRERVLARRVSTMIVSSTALKQRWARVHPDVKLVRNGVDVSETPALKVVTATRSTKVLGYVGTIAAWFDWDWVIALAKARPTDVVRLIGPVFTRVPTALPKNIEILPPRPHQAAMEAMRDFDVGLIPFQKSGLTESVDPIKYYEYRALGLPVLSTAFGEMKRREGEKGTFVTSDASKTPGLVEKALSHRTDEDEIRRFSEANSWETRFGAANIL